MQEHTHQPQGQPMSAPQEPQPTQTNTGGSGMGMQPEMGTAATERMMGLRLQDVETVQQRNAVEHITRAIQVCEFCADQCIRTGDPHMAECIRLCRDVSELGETAMKLIPRDSRYAEMALETFTQALQDCAQECASHQDAHCQECAEALPQAQQAIEQYLQFE